MIVKDESKVILRCLESVRPIVDYVLVEDTGSTDGTQGIIRQWLDRVELPGEVYDEPWRDFAYNRSHVLAKLREHKAIDYALMMDADDLLIFEDGFDPLQFKKGLFKDAYEVSIHRFDVTYYRLQICSNRRPFKYRGVLHEFLEVRPAVAQARLPQGFTSTHREREAHAAPIRRSIVETPRFLNWPYAPNATRICAPVIPFTSRRPIEVAARTRRHSRHIWHAAKWASGTREVIWSLYMARIISRHLVGRLMRYYPPVPKPQVSAVVGPKRYTTPVDYAA